MVNLHAHKRCFETKASYSHYRALVRTYNVGFTLPGNSCELAIPRSGQSSPITNTGQSPPLEYFLDGALCCESKFQKVIQALREKSEKNQEIKQICLVLHMFNKQHIIADNESKQLQP